MKEFVSTSLAKKRCLGTDLLCLSHLRWDFVFQRPQHLMTRYAQHRRVFYVEEPVFDECATPYLEVSPRQRRLFVITPHFPNNFDHTQISERTEQLLNRAILDYGINDYTLWYFTPMALLYSRGLTPNCVVYDCMDELSAFKNAPRQLIELEKELFEKANWIFTGGQSLYESKKRFHPRVYPFPSSIDFAHFAQARDSLPDPADQCAIPHLRLGFYGVIDERCDLGLLREIAAERPEWHLVLLGPTAKIEDCELPRARNIHYLGKKEYRELPKYLAHWDVAILPFAMNESTRFISPTKTPEYLAGGKPVVSTPIKDVVTPYGKQGLVHIAESPVEFIDKVELALRDPADATWLPRVDDFLKDLSWDKTWSSMAAIEKQAIDFRTIYAGDSSAVRTT